MKTNFYRKELSQSRLSLAIEQQRKILVLKKIS
jgi:hypothetical protein